MWYLIDAAEPNKVIRFLPEDAEVSERWIQRAIRPPSLATLATLTIETVISSKAGCSREVDVRGVSTEILATPILDPDGAVLAIQMYVGPKAGARPKPPAVDAFIWDGLQWTVMSSGVGGAVLPADYPLLHGAWLLSRIIECEERDKLITAALEPVPGVAWEGPMRVMTADDDGRTTRVYGYFRYHGPNRLRGLLLEIEEERRAGILLPTYHLDAAAALLGGTTALIDLTTMQIVEWLTPPLKNIAWRHHPASRGTDPSSKRSAFNLTTTHIIHPDDLSIYLTALTDLAADKAEFGRGQVRLLTVDGGWLLVELYTIRLPHGPKRFLTCLIKPVENLPVTV